MATTDPNIVYVGTSLSISGGKIHRVFSSEIQHHIEQIVNTYGLEYDDFEVMLRLELKPGKAEKFKKREFPIEPSQLKFSSMGRLQHDDPALAGEQVVECEKELKDDYPDLYDNIRDIPSYQDAYELVEKQFAWKYPSKILLELTTKIRM
jgi:hypothetical protein